MSKRIAIVGAGPAGLMAAEVLSQFDYELHVYEQKPSAARKFLMAGKTGLNISHAEPVQSLYNVMIRWSGCPLGSNSGMRSGFKTG